MAWNKDILGCIAVKCHMMESEIITERAFRKCFAPGLEDSISFCHCCQKFRFSFPVLFWYSRFLTIILYAVA